MKQAMIGLSLTLAAMSIAAAPSDTLITSKSGNAWQPGIATSWTVTGSGNKTQVVLALQPGADVNSIVLALRDVLPQASVEPHKGGIKITGVEEKALMPVLASTIVTENADPLASLSGLSGAVAVRSPDAGGSIRATNPAKVDQLTQNAGDELTMAKAEVLEVVRGTFPRSTIKLRLRSKPTLGPLRDKLALGRVVEAAVHWGDANPVALTSEEAQENAVAYYLQKGDRVLVGLIENERGFLTIATVRRTKP